MTPVLVVCNGKVEKDCYRFHTQAEAEAFRQGMLLGLSSHPSKRVDVVVDGDNLSDDGLFPFPRKLVSELRNRLATERGAGGKGL